MHPPPRFGHPFQVATVFILPPLAGACRQNENMFYLSPVEYNLADLFEHAADVFADREYLVAGDKRRTYREMDERANQLAHHLASVGVGPGDHVGIYAYNRAEWVETLWAVFKLRAVWININ